MTRVCLELIPLKAKVAYYKPGMSELVHVTHYRLLATNIIVDALLQIIEETF